MCVELGSSGFPSGVDYAKVVRIVVKDPNQPECLRLLREQKFSQLKVLEFMSYDSLAYLEAALIGKCPLITVQIAALNDAVIKILLLFPTLKNLEVREAGNEKLAEELPHLRRLEFVSSDHSVFNNMLDGYQHLGFKRTHQTLRDLLTHYPHLTSFKIYTGSFGKDFYKGIREEDKEWIVDRSLTEFITPDRSQSLATLLFKGWLRGLVPEKIIEFMVEKGVYLREALIAAKYDKIQLLYQTTFWKKLVEANLDDFLKGRICFDREGKVISYLYEICKDSMLNHFLFLAARHDKVKYFEKLKKDDPILDKLKGILFHVGSSQVRLMHVLFEKGYKPSLEEQTDENSRNYALRMMLALRGYRMSDMRESVIRMDIEDLYQIILLERGGPLDEEGNNCFHFIGGNYYKLSRLLEVLPDFSLLFAQNAKGETPFSMKDNHQILMLEKMLKNGFSLTFEKGQEKFMVQGNR